MPIYFQVTSSRLPISIGSIGNQWYQESIVRKEGYPHYHWLQTETGFGDININKRILRLEEGDGILIKPFVPHTYFSNLGWVTKFVTFNGTLSDEYSKIIGTGDYILKSDSEKFNFSSWIDDTIDLHKNNAKNEVELSVSTYNFLMQVGQVTQEDYFEDLNYQKYVQPIITLIESNFQSSFTLEKLASDLFISPQYLSRIFKKYTNQTIFSYLHNIRMKKSKELLINHRYLKIQEITDMCGFSDTSYFISAFKKETGYTPLRFRKLYLIRNHN